jgi:hypothetical protein
MFYGLQAAKCITHNQGRLSVMWVDTKGAYYLWNVGKLLPDYTVQHLRRQPPWVHEIPHEEIFQCDNIPSSKHGCS